jgi:hypothetical protein
VDTKLLIPKRQKNTNIFLAMAKILLLMFVCTSIPMVHDLCQNINIFRDRKKLNEVGGWVESWWVV